MELVVRLAGGRAGALERVLPPCCIAPENILDMSCGARLCLFQVYAWQPDCQALSDRQACGQGVRMRLGPDANGRLHGITQGQALAQSWLPLLPPVVALMLARFVWTGVPSQLQFLLFVPVLSLPKGAFDLLAVVVGYSALSVSAVLTWSIIPSAVRSYLSTTWDYLAVWDWMPDVFHSRRSSYCARSYKAQVHLSMTAS
jgi:hypothetical protein